MSKVLAATMLTAGTAAVSVGGAYVIQKWFGEELKPKSLEEFKSDKGDECSKSLFGDIDFKQGLPSTQFDASNPSSTDFFGTPSNDDGKNKSCLTINWQKKSKNDGGKDKWSGILTWSWSFINDKKGFVTFNVAKTAASNKLKITGGAYLLEQEGVAGSETWKIKHYKEIKENDAKEVETTDFVQYIPQAKEDKDTFKVNGKLYWGWVDDDKNLGEVLDEGDANVSSQKPTFPPKELSWEWSKGETGQLTDWAKDFEWWKKLYIQNNFALETVLTSFQGAWTEKTTKPAAA